MSRRSSPPGWDKALDVQIRPPKPPRVKAPAFDNSELIRRHALTAIGRLTNPLEQKVWSLIPFLADHWKFSSRPIGADLGNGLFQFQFANEKDLATALRNQPYHFSQWMVIFQRWEPTIDRSFPSQIPFWISVQGIPVHLWSEGILESIAKQIGHLDRSDVSPTYFRMRVIINGLKPLVMSTIVEFADGSELEAFLVYEKLRNYCKACYMLDHSKESCPLLSREASKRCLDSHSVRFSDRKEAESSHSEAERRVSGASDSWSRSRRRESSPLRSSHHRSGHQTERSRRFRESGGAFRRRDERESHRELSRADSSRRSDSYSGLDLRSSLSRRQSDSVHLQSHRRRSPSHSFSRPENRSVPAPLDKGKGILQNSLPGSDATTSQRLDGLNPGFPFSSSSLHTTAPLPAQEALDTAMGELREVMTQYANCPDPTESAARRARVRQAEELGEFEETAEQMVRATLPVNLIPSTESFAEEGNISSERIPASQRLGPTNVEVEGPSIRRRTTGKKRLGRPPGKKASPSKLVGIKSKKKKFLNQQTIPFPRRRINMEQVPPLEESPNHLSEEPQARAPPQESQQGFRRLQKRLT